MSSDYPTTPGAFDETHSPFLDEDVFVTRLDPTGSSLSYSTFLGDEKQDRARAIAVDRHGRATVVGTTYSYLFPVTSGAFDTFCPQFSCEKGFVTRLAEDGSALVWSTWLGGFNGPEPPAAVAVDEGGTTFVVGQTNAEDFPITVGAFDRALNDGLDTGKLDGFLARLGPDGGRLFYSTFLGGAVQDEAHGLAVDSDQSVVVAGVTWSDDFPTTPGAYDTVKSPGFPDGFVTRLDPSPTGATKYGTSTPGGLGPLAVGVTAAPTVGRADFGVFCVATPPGGAGLVCLSSGPAPGPLDVSGAAFYLDLAGLLVLPLVGGPEGYTEVPAPIPADPSLAGLKAYVQFLFQDPAASGGVAASNALEIEVNS